MFAVNAGLAALGLAFELAVVISFLQARWSPDAIKDAVWH
jgi:hypothetical protein